MSDAVVTRLFARLEEAVRATMEGREPAHDFSHVTRVVRHARVIARGEGANEEIAALAALLHELVTLPKSDPLSWRAGDLCATEAAALLAREDAPSEVRDAVALAIRDHAFSKGVVPPALESRVLQDADRLDALGAIGLARMWATCADMKRPLYAPDDPFCDARAPDDKQWGLDHVYKKLLVVPERLHTKTALLVAETRVATMLRYVAALREELDVDVDRDPGRDQTRGA